VEFLDKLTCLLVEFTVLLDSAIQAITVGHVFQAADPKIRQLRQRFALATVEAGVEIGNPSGSGSGFYLGGGLFCVIC
jgi:hypothetical protein